MPVPRELLESSGMMALLEAVIRAPGISERDLCTSDGGLNGAMAKHERIRMLDSLGLIVLDRKGGGWDDVLVYPTEKGIALFMPMHLQ